jgi:hypothetical protein
MKHFNLFLLGFFFTTSILYARTNHPKAPIEHRWQMTIEKFVHLTQAEKNQVLIKTMELMVELEAKYHKEISSHNNQSNEVIKKYVHILKQIKNFLLSEAVAAEFSDLGKDYVQLMNKLGSKACIYAGWVSTIYEDGKGHFYCLHPTRSSVKEVRDIYNQTNPASNKCDSSKIACNPMVFGFKKFDKKTTFCVDASISGSTYKSHNAAYSCMKNALEENPKDITIQDTKHDRLKTLSDAVSSSPESKAIFSGVHDYIFKSCVCKDQPKDIKMHSRYRNYMRPHRTCLGMIQSLKELNSSTCVDFSTKMTDSSYTGFINEWNEFFKKNTPPVDMKNYSMIPDQNIEKEYKKLIDSSEMTAYCKGELPKPAPQIEEKKTYTCDVNCKEVTGNDGGKTFDCFTPGGYQIKEILTGPSGTNETDLSQDLYKEELKKITSIDEKNQFTLKLKDLPEITCQASIEKSKEKPVCKTECKKEKSSEGKEIITCAVSFTKKVNEKEESIPVGDEIKKTVPTDLTGKESFSLIYENEEIVCPVSASQTEQGETEEEDKKSCEIKFTELEGEDKIKKIKASVSFQGFKDDKDPESFNWSEGVADEKDKKSVTLEKKTEEREISVKFGDKDDEKCVGKVPAASGAKNDEAKKFSIDLQADSYKDEDASISVKAIIKNDKSEVVSLPEGYKVSWTRSGTGASKVKDTKKQESKATGDNIDGKSSEAKPLFEGEFSTSSSGISAQRVEDDYTVTAHLVNATGKEESKDDEKIPLLKKSSSPSQNPNYNYNNGAPPRNAPTFQFSPLNTSSQGIQ